MESGYERARRLEDALVERGLAGRAAVEEAVRSLRALHAAGGARLPDLRQLLLERQALDPAAFLRTLSLSGDAPVPSPPPPVPAPAPGRISAATPW